MGGGPPSPSDEASFRTNSSEDAVDVTHKSANLQVFGHVPEAGGHDVGSSVGASRASSQAEDAPNQDSARLLYSKSKVYLHPTSYLRDNIPGYISIVQVGKPNNREFLLAWIPEASVVGTKDHEAFVLVELGHAGEVNNKSGTGDAADTLVTITPPSLTSDHAFSVPIRSLYSVQVQPPTLAAWFGSMTLSVYGGTTFGPLFFHDEESASTVLDRDRRAAALSALGAERRNGGGSSKDSDESAKRAKIPPSWGGEALLSQLRQYAHVVRSQLEPSLFLVNPSRADLDVHSTALFDDEAVPTEAMLGMGLRNDGHDGVDGGESRFKRESRRHSILHKSLDGRHVPSSDDYPDEVGPAMDNFTFNVLNSFSKITRGARSAAQSAAQSVLSHPLAKPILKNIPEPIAHFANAPGELTRLQETAGVGAYDGARVYLAKWARVVAEEGERARRAEVVLSGPGGRSEDSQVGAFEVLSSTYHVTRPKSTRAHGTPIVDTEWAAWFDDSGKLLLDELEAKKRIFQRGLAPDVRKEAWSFLLDVYPWNSDVKQRKAIRDDKTRMYESLKARWSNDAALQKTERFIEESHRVEIDCRRTDRTHAMFSANDEGIDPTESPHPPSNAHVKQTQEILLTYVFAEPDRDYVQGMSDLLSPIYVVCDGDQVLAFWCFTRVMERMKKNFLRDQSGMKHQLSLLQGLIRTMDVQLYKHLEACGALNLFFCFRWILCSFKRELTFDQTLQLWEVLWTDHLGTHFHLFVALAILEAHRDIIIRYLREFDEVLKYITQLAGTHDVEDLMSSAEVLHATFRQVVHASDEHRLASGDVVGGGGGGADASKQDGQGLRRRATTAAAASKSVSNTDDTSLSEYPPRVPDKDQGSSKPNSSGGNSESSLARQDSGGEGVVVVEDVPQVDEELRELLT